MAVNAKYVNEVCCKKSQIDAELPSQSMKDHILSKKVDSQCTNSCRFSLKGRGIFHSEDKNYMMWIDDEDRMRIISMEHGSDLGKTFDRLIHGIKAVESKSPFSHSTFSKSECTISSRLSPFARLKKVFSSLVNMIKQGKTTQDQLETSTTVVNNEQQSTAPMHAEVLSVTDDEYERILEDLELMAEERIKTLVEASNRELNQTETPPMSIHPTISGIKSCRSLEN